MNEGVNGERESEYVCGPHSVLSPRFHESYIGDDNYNRNQTAPNCFFFIEIIRVQGLEYIKQYKT
jgi:hypothetical protein